MTIDDVDVVEINEAFAAQIVPCRDELGIPDEKLNPFGGAIALGHPFGMTGARIMTTLINGLRALDGTLRDRVDVRRRRHGPGDADRASELTPGCTRAAGVRCVSTQTGGVMSRLIRLDETGHTTLAEWSAEDPAAFEEAAAAFRAELDRGYFGIASLARRQGGADHRAAARGADGDPAAADRRRLRSGAPTWHRRRGAAPGLPERAAVYVAPAGGSAARCAAAAVVDIDDRRCTRCR